MSAVVLTTCVLSTCVRVFSSSISVVVSSVLAVSTAPCISVSRTVSCVRIAGSLARPSVPCVCVRVAGSPARPSCRVACGAQRATDWTACVRAACCPRCTSATGCRSATWARTRCAHPQTSTGCRGRAATT